MKAKTDMTPQAPPRGEQTVRFAGDLAICCYYKDKGPAIFR